MKTYGLIGQSLDHSFSASYFQEKFQQEGITNARYVNFPLKSLDEFKNLIATEQLSGLNVTIPYKESIIPYLDDLSAEAAKIGAVNTICFENNKLTGHNTDVYGFSQSIKPFLESQHENALVLGTGGASKAVSHALTALGIQVYFVSQTKSGDRYFSYDKLNDQLIHHFKLIVNCTPLGTYPNTKEKPSLAYEGLSKDHLLYDLVYNPAETSFLNEGKKKGASICNGLSMLQLQAEKSWELWNA